MFYTIIINHSLQCLDYPVFGKCELFHVDIHALLPKIRGTINAWLLIYWNSPSSLYIFTLRLKSIFIAKAIVPFNGELYLRAIIWMSSVCSCWVVIACMCFSLIGLRNNSYITILLFLLSYYKFLNLNITFNRNSIHI